MKDNSTVPVQATASHPSQVEIVVGFKIMLTDEQIHHAVVREDLGENWKKQAELSE